jgi:hypothetical protein
MHAPAQTFTRKLSFDELRASLEYDADTGIFRRKVTVASNARAGGVAGYRKPDGYWLISIDHRRFYAHRLAWFYVHGEWPAGMIDHINGDPGDNRIANLREATHAENGRNARRATRNKSGFKGVFFSKQGGSWQAALRLNGRTIYLGRYSTAEAAHAAYLEGAKQHFGEFARAK